MAARATGSGPMPLRPMDIPEILDYAFTVLRRGWKPLILAGAIASVPTALMVGLINQSAVEPAIPSPFFLLGTGPTWLFVTALLVVLTTPWFQGAMVVLASRVCLGEAVTVGEALRLAGRRYPALLGTMLLKWLLFILAMVILPVAGLLIFAWATLPAGLTAMGVYLVFYYHAIVLEQTGGGIAALRRSIGLANGQFWRLLGLGIVFTFLVGALGMLIYTVTSLPFDLWLDFGAPSPVATWLSAIAGIIGQAVTTALSAVGLTMAYYDVRMRKEGFDLDRMLASIPSDGGM